MCFRQILGALCLVTFLMIVGCVRVSPKDNSKDTKESTPADKAEDSSDVSMAIYNGITQKVASIGYYAFGNNLCSAVEVADRCILTASNCTANYNAPGLGTPRYGQQPSVTPNIEEVPAIRELQYSVVPRLGIQSDLKLVWLAGQYFNFTTRAVQGFTTFAPKIIALPPQVGTEVWIAGYGYHSVNNGGIGTARSGIVKISKITDISASPTVAAGQYITLKPSSALLQSVCSGDNGGPVLYGGKVVGIISGGANLCSPTSAQVNPASAESHATSFGNGNLLWIQQNVPQFCRPKVTVIVSTGQTSNVSGTLAGGLKIINCDHSGGPNRSCRVDGISSNVTIKATPGPSFKFSRWVDGGIGKSCPCDPTNPICTIPVTFLNYTTPGPGMEEANCQATYVTAPMMPPSPGPSTAPAPSTSPSPSTGPAASQMPPSPMR